MEILSITSDLDRSRKEKKKENTMNGIIQSTGRFLLLDVRPYFYCSVSPTDFILFSTHFVRVVRHTKSTTFEFVGTDSQ